MMLVKSVLKPSKIHGVGIFAAEPIRKGSLIWIFNPIVDKKITKGEFENLPAVAKEQIKNYAYLNEEGEYILCGDNARFFNHSANPNTREEDDLPDVLNNREGRTIAARDIKVGEEITCDYASFDYEYKEKLSKS